MFVFVLFAVVLFSFTFRLSVVTFDSDVELLTFVFVLLAVEFDVLLLVFTFVFVLLEVVELVTF